MKDLKWRPPPLINRKERFGVLSLDTNDGVAETRFRRSNSEGNWPSNDMFLTESARGKIKRIYAKDFGAYADFLADASTGINGVSRG